MPTVSTKFFQLFDQPPVFVVSSGLRFKTGIQAALHSAKGKPCHIIVQPSWYVPDQAFDMHRISNAVMEKIPTVKFTFICPTLAETNYLKNIGINAFHIHKNAFIDSRVFTPDCADKKRFNAIHIANVMPFKRHHLAWGVKNIAVITYDYTGHVKQFDQLAGYKNLSFGNFSLSNGSVKLNDITATKETSMSRMSMSPYEVSRAVCESKCGIILSAIEGSNNASTEYLLCGIPLVTTESLGGRSEFYDPRHVKIVAPLPHDVESAVQHFCDNPIDKYEIRNSVMTKIREHRKRFITLLSSITKKDLFLEVDADFWHPNFTNKLMTRAEVDPTQTFGVDILAA